MQGSAPSVNRVPKLKRLLWTFGVTAFVVLLDQATKLWIQRTMISSGPPIRVIGDIVRIAFVENPNAVFGLSLGAKFPYELITILATALLIFLIIKERIFSHSLVFGLLLGGALGNVIDRMRFGMVTDFIDIGISQTQRWPVFNVADSAVTVGLITFVIVSFTQMKKTREKEESLKETSEVKNDIPN
jgi:signal peptidase II